MLFGTLGRETRLGFALSPRRNPGLSLSRTALIKSAVLARSLTYFPRLFPGENRNLDALRALENCYVGRYALVIAGGPSSSLIDYQKVEELQRLGSLHVVVINRFFASKIGATITPDFYLLSDPGSGPHGHLGSWREEIFDRYPHTTLFVPSHWSYADENEFRFASQVIAFENRSLEGWGRGFSPVKLRRYLGLSALSALAVASFLGYSKIGIIGLDATEAFTLSVDLDNRMFLAPNHHEGAAGTGDTETNLISRRRGDGGKYLGNYRNASDLFFGQATLHDHLDRFFGHNEAFVNLSESSVVTSFQRQTADDFFHEIQDRNREKLLRSEHRPA